MFSINVGRRNTHVKEEVLPTCVDCKLFCCLVMVEQSVKMRAISTPCTTLSPIRNLRSKAIFSWWKLMECVDTQDDQKEATAPVDLHYEPGGLVCAT
jgi:hypothetical protein